MYFCSLDAIDPSLPHHRGNVQWTCLRVNLGERERCAHMFANALTLDAGKQLYPDAEFRDWARRALRFVVLYEGIVELKPHKVCTNLAGLLVDVPCKGCT